MIPSVLSLLGFSASPPVAPGTAQGVMPFPHGFLESASPVATVPPPPPPPPSEAVGGWTYDPYSRRRKIKRDDEEQIPVPPPAIVPPAPYQPPAVDLAALDRQIAALEARIKESRRGRTKLRAEAARLQLERDMHARFERHRKLLADDDEWFLLN